MKRVAVLGLLCLLNVAVAHSQQPSATPADFSFVLEYGSARQLVLDTAKGTFARDTDHPTFITTIKLILTADEMNQIFRELVRIDFWNATKYPRVFSYPPPIPGERRTGVVPCGQFLFSVTSRGQVKELSWEDCFLSRSPPYAPADELRDVFNTIHRFIE
jgi:hypothetical protein